MLRLSAVEINHMQALETEPLKVLRHACGRVAINSFLFVIALLEPYALAVDYIYCGYKFYHLCPYILLNVCFRTPNDAFWHSHLCLMSTSLVYI